ncbi:MAG: type I-E CRISPR-associated endoribonuclease Cas2e [Bacillota bacterium]|jgi:CRISPR-associated protein Cas2|nr:type I-E CRISPR-associated endoribonuclease Cas2e [Bacillota bacterium]
MSLTVVVTRNVHSRIRGFLASSMLEVGPGVYTTTSLSAGARERVWKVLEEWFEGGDTSIVMVWDDRMESKQSVKVLGLPPIDLVSVDGLIVARKPFRDPGT